LLDTITTITLHAELFEREIMENLIKKIEEERAIELLK